MAILLAAGNLAISFYNSLYLRDVQLKVCKPWFLVLHW